MAQSKVKFLLFDVGGTVFDWMTAVETALEPLAPPGYGAAERHRFAVDWRAGFFAHYGDVLAGKRPWADAEEITNVVLGDLLAARPEIVLSQDQRDDLARAWQAMPSWPDRRDGIARLREDYMVLPFTLLTWAMVAGSSKVSGIVWDGILSCDLLGVYKPAPESYRRVSEILRASRDRMMMVAAHPSDLDAAAAEGMRTAYVLPRLKDPGEDYRDRGFAERFDIVAEDFVALAERLCR